MSDTSSGLAPEIKRFDRRVTEAYVMDAIDGRGPHTHQETAQRLTNEMDPSSKGDRSRIMNVTDGAVIAGDDLWQNRRIGAGTGQIATGRNRHPERLMRPFGVVNLPKRIERDLGFGDVSEGPELTDIGLHRAMPAFDLALGLGMIRSAMDDPDAEPDEPGFEPGDRPWMGGAPRSAVIGEDRPRAAILRETRGQVLLDQFPTLVDTGEEAQAEPRMVIAHRQGMDLALAQPVVPLEVDLPQLIGGGPLELLEPAWLRGPRVNQIMAPRPRSAARCAARPPRLRRSAGSAGDWSGDAGSGPPAPPHLPPDSA